MNEGGLKQSYDEPDGQERNRGEVDGGGQSHPPSVARKRVPVISERMQAYMTKPVPQKQLKCTVTGCGKIFSSTPGLRYHYERIHSPYASSYSCDRCKREFKSRNGLKYHQQKTKCQDSTIDVAPTSPSSVHQQPPVAILPPLPPPESDDNSSLTSCQRIPAKNDETDSILESASDMSSQDWPEPRHRKMESRRKQLEQQLRQQEQNARELRQPLTSFQHPGWLPPVEQKGSSEAGPLLEFANIATGPQSPLLREMPIDWTSVSTGGMMSSQWWESSWQCFFRDTRICLGRAQVSSQLYVVETLAAALSQGHGPSLPEDLSQPVPLCLIDQHTLEDSDTEVELVFRCESHNQSCLTACCQSYHPFFVRKKGWASCNNGRTKEILSLLCKPLEIGDVCLPLSSIQQAHTAKDTEGTEVNSLEYSSAIFLSEMAQVKAELQKKKCPDYWSQKQARTDHH